MPISVFRFLPGDIYFLWRKPLDIIKNIIADYDKHYKRLKDRYTLKDGTIDEQAIKDCTDDDILKHYDLLQLDALDKIYLPYMKKDFLWTNDEKRFILQKINDSDRDLLPNEIRQLLNEYKQKQ